MGNHTATRARGRSGGVAATGAPVTDEQAEDIMMTTRIANESATRALYYDHATSAQARAEARAALRSVTREDVQRDVQRASTLYPRGKVDAAVQAELEKNWARTIGAQQAFHQTVNKTYTGLQPVEAAQIIRAEAARVNREGVTLHYPGMLQEEHSAGNGKFAATLRADSKRYERGDTEAPKPTPPRAHETLRQQNDRLFADERRLEAYHRSGPGKDLPYSAPSHQLASRIGAERYGVAMRMNAEERAKQRASQAREAAKAARAQAAKDKADSATARAAARATVARYEGNNAFEALQAGRAVAVRATDANNLHIIVPEGKPDDQGRMRIATYFGGAKKPYSEREMTVDQVMRVFSNNTNRTVVLQAGWKPPTYTAKSTYAHLTERYNRAAAALQRAREAVSPSMQIRINRVAGELALARQRGSANTTRLEQELAGLNERTRFGQRQQDAAIARMNALEDAMLAGPQRSSSSRRKSA